LRKNLPPQARIGLCGPPGQSGRRSIFGDFQILIELQNPAGSRGEPVYGQLESLILAQNERWRQA
jgi:hypothetical protein